MDFDRKIEFYQHDQKWANRMILGNSLHVMTSLAEKEGLKGKVQMIYIDPPYGIKFGSNWQVSTRKRDVKDGKVRGYDAAAGAGAGLPGHLEARHSLVPGVLRDWLAVARELLTETGSIFVQIGDENVHLVRCLLDEVFGRENFAAQIAFKSTDPLGQKGLPQAYDYLLWYAKDIES